MSLPVSAQSAVFLVSAPVSLGASYLLVTRLERVAARLGFSEALLGLVAALAADGPEITSAIAALGHHDDRIGAGVVLGSNVFNLAALLGLGAVVAGGIAMHRRVVVLTGSVGLWSAGCALLAVAGLLPSWAALLLVLVVFVPYVVGAALRRHADGDARHRWRRFIGRAFAEEERELMPALHPAAGGPSDVVAAGLALAVVAGASLAMEATATTLGRHLGVADLVTGGVVLAVVTSLPNVVAAVYLATRRRGAAVLSTAFNSNAINVVAGLLVPGSVVGLGAASVGSSLAATFYATLTAALVIVAWAHVGLGRSTGIAVMAAYGIFVAAVVAVPQKHHSAVWAAGAVVVGVVVVAAASLGRRSPTRR